MKPVSHTSRPKEWIPLTNFAMVDKVPDSLKLRDHLVPFVGAQPDPKFLYGLYGTSSANHALFLASNYASRNKKQCLTLQLWYHVDNFDRVKSKITAEIAEEAGFIHLDRLQSGYRDSLRDVALTSLHETLSAPQYDVISKMSLDEIMIRHPEAVKALFAANKKVNVIVHPVRQSFDPNDTKTLHVATVRYIKDRLVTAEVRYLEHINVEI